MLLESSFDDISPKGQQYETSCRTPVRRTSAAMSGYKGRCPWSWPRAKQRQFTPCTNPACMFQYSYADRDTCFQCASQLARTAPRVGECKQQVWPANKNNKEDPSEASKQAGLQNVLKQYKAMGYDDEAEVVRAAQQQLDQIKDNIRDQKMDAKTPWAQVVSKNI